MRSELPGPLLPVLQFEATATGKEDAKSGYLGTGTSSYLTGKGGGFLTVN